MQYLAPSGEIRRLPAINLQSLVAAHQSICNASPIKRAMPKREAIDGTPCPNCGASGWKGCDHQFAAPPPRCLVSSSQITNDADPRVSLNDCHAVLDEIDRFLAKLGVSRVWFANSLGRSQYGLKGLYSTLEEGRARSGMIVKIRTFIKNHEGNLA